MVVLLQALRGYFGNEGALTKTLCESLGVDAESGSDPNSGDDAGVDISIDGCSAKAQKPSHLGNRERPLYPLNLREKRASTLRQKFFDDSWTLLGPRRVLDDAPLLFLLASRTQH